MKTFWAIVLVAVALICAPVFAGGARVPEADSTRNRTDDQVIGNKTDAAVTTVGTTKSLVAYAKGALGAAGAINDTTTDSTNGKLGTDAEMGDNSLWDYTVPAEVVGETDIDISEADYTTYITLLTIAPATGQSLVDCVVDLDWNKTTTGWDTASTVADTLDIAVTTTVDGTNSRGMMSGTQVTSSGNGTLTADEDGERFAIGMVGVDGAAIIKVKLSAEVGDAEIPYRVTYRGAAPTITAVAIP